MKPAAHHLALVVLHWLLTIMLAIAFTMGSAVELDVTADELEIDGVDWIQVDKHGLINVVTVSWYPYWGSGRSKLARTETGAQRLKLTCRQKN